MDVLKLLQSKNRCLQKFLKCSEDFLAFSESGDLTYIHKFQKQRNSIVKALLLYDIKISEIVKTLSENQKTTSLIDSIKKILIDKEDLVQTILITDQRIIVQIEKEKSRLLKELSTSDKSSQQVKKFRSKWISESGEKLDGKL